MAFFRGLRPTWFDADVGGGDGFVGALKVAPADAAADTSEEGKPCSRGGSNSSLNIKGAKRSCCGSGLVGGAAE